MDEIPSQPPPEPLPVSDVTPIVSSVSVRRRNYFWPVVSVVLVFVFVVVIGASYVLFTNISADKSGLSTTTANVTPTPYVFAARVGYLTGNAWKIVNYRRTELLEGDVITEGDEIVTEKDTRVVLLFDEGSVIRISDNANVILSQLIPSSMVLRNQRGIVYARVKKDQEHVFAIKAKSYTVTSTGTSFSVENQDEVKVKVYESKVEISDDSSTATRAGKPTEVAQMQQWQENNLVPEMLNNTDVANNSFLAWSLKEDRLASTPAAAVTPVIAEKSAETPSSGTITLTGNSRAEGIQLSWQVTGGLPESKGFQIMKKISSNPSYPADPSQYVADPAGRQYLWNMQDGQTWHFRVCRFTGVMCGVYSNDISLKAPSGPVAPPAAVPEGQVSSITLKGQKIASNTAGFTWIVGGYSSQGFKIVWSVNSGPTFPLRDGDQYHFFAEPDKSDDEISGLESGKTYYFRVCEMRSGACGVYSNEIKVTI